MAIKQNNLLTQNGLNIPSAYIRVDSFMGSKYSVRLNVGIYNVVEETKEVHTPTEKEVEITNEDGTTSTQTITEDVITTETVEVKKRVEEITHDMVPDLVDSLNILQQGYTELKNNLYPNSIDC